MAARSPGDSAGAGGARRPSRAHAHPVWTPDARHAPHCLARAHAPQPHHPVAPQGTPGAPPGHTPASPPCPAPRQGTRNRRGNTLRTWIRCSPADCVCPRRPRQPAPRASPRTRRDPEHCVCPRRPRRPRPTWAHVPQPHHARRAQGTRPRRGHTLCTRIRCSLAGCVCPRSLRVRPADPADPAGPQASGTARPAPATAPPPRATLH